jgi:flagellar basal body-associated protein FliL
MQIAISKRGETLISLLIGVVLMAIAISGIVAIIIYNQSIDEDYKMNNTIFILQSNAENIAQKTNTSLLAEKDIFYLYKDPLSRTFQVFTGATNDRYKYINRDGEFVTNTGSSYTDTLYTRILSVEKKETTPGDVPHQVIK